MNVTELLTMTVEEVKAHILDTLEILGVPYTKGENYIVTDIYDWPCPLICVHTDTISKLPPKPEDLIVKDNVISLSEFSDAYCLGGDDRAGIWIALQMLIHGTESNFEYGFFDLEEKFGIGSQEYALTKPDHTCYIGLDRASKDLAEIALYGYDSNELIDYFVEIGYEIGSGTFSDCSQLSSYTGKPCVNVSIGYYREHSKREELDIDKMEEALETMQNIVIPDGVEFEMVDQELEKALCDVCNEHKPLYFWGSQVVCSDCLKLIKEN